MREVPLHVYFIGAGFLISLWRYRVNVNTPYLRFFPAFLLISIIIEVIAANFWSQGEDNVIIYNFFTLFEFAFYFIVQYQTITDSGFRKILTISAFAYFVLSFANIFFYQGLHTFHTITYSLGCLLICTYSIFFLFEIFRLPKSISLTRVPSFWINIGLIFFYCCSFPFFALSGLLEGSSSFILDNLDKFIMVLNILLYSLFSISFLCQTKVKGYSSSS